MYSVEDSADGIDKNKPDESLTPFVKVLLIAFSFPLSLSPPLQKERTETSWPSPLSSGSLFLSAAAIDKDVVRESEMSYYHGSRMA